MKNLPVNPVELAQALLRIPSVNPDFDPAAPAECDIAPWIARWARELGFDVETQSVLPNGRDNVVVRIRNGADRPHVIFNGHTDTVGVAGMTIDPYGGEIRGGRLWGRGASDMKGPLAAMLASAVRLRDSSSSWRGTLSVACVADEENAYRGTLALMDRIDPASVDFAVVGEPTQLHVVRGCKGCLRFALTARGRAAHSSEPHKGRSAIVAMADAIVCLEEFFRTRLTQITRPQFGTSTGSIGQISGGSGINIVPETCEVRVDIRLLPGQRWQTTYAELREFVRQRATRVAGIEWTFSDPPLLTDIPFDTPADHLLVRRACEVTGDTAASVVMFGCDASKMSDRGVPSIVLGPGDIAQAHTADESIALDDLERGTDCYVRLVRALMPA